MKSGRDVVVGFMFFSFHLVIQCSVTQIFVSVLCYCSTLAHKDKQLCYLSDLEYVLGEPVQVASCSSHWIQLYPLFLPYFAFLLIPNTASAEILSHKAVTDITVCVYQHRKPQEGPKPAGGLQKQPFCPVYFLGTTSPVIGVWVWFFFCLFGQLG